MSSKFCFYLFFVFIVMQYACKDIVYYEKNVSLEETVWKYEDMLYFPLSLGENKKSKRLFFNLRHTADYDFSNIFIKLTNTKPNNQTDTLLLEFSLAYPDGRWKGVGSGSILSYSLPIDTLDIQRAGLYTLTLQQFMRVDTLRHIMNVGIRIE